MVGGPAGQSARVQRGDNLRDYRDWQTVTLGDRPVDLADPDATAATSRFYRAVSP